MGKSRIKLIHFVLQQQESRQKWTSGSLFKPIYIQFIIFSTTRKLLNSGLKFSFNFQSWPWPAFNHFHPFPVFYPFFNSLEWCLVAAKVTFFHYRNIFSNSLLSITQPAIKRKLVVNLNMIILKQEVQLSNVLSGFCFCHATAKFFCIELVYIF